MVDTFPRTNQGALNKHSLCQPMVQFKTLVWMNRVLPWIGGSRCLRDGFRWWKMLFLYKVVLTQAREEATLYLSMQKGKSDVRLRNEPHPFPRQMDALFTSRLCAWPKLDLNGSWGRREEGREVLDKIELSLSNCTTLCSNKYATQSFSQRASSSARGQAN